MNTSSKSQRGDAAQFLVLAKLSEAGIIAMLPTCQALPYDIAFTLQGHIYKAQIKRAQVAKYGRFKIPLYQVRPTRNGKTVKVRYSTTEVDFLVGVVMETGDCYFLPLAEFNQIRFEIAVDPYDLGELKPRLPQEKYRNRIAVSDGQLAQLLEFRKRKSEESNPIP